MVDENLLARIRKLLELGSADRNSCAAEAQAAMAKVAELLTRHNLEMAAVQGSGPGQADEVGSIPGKRYVRLSTEEHLVAMLLVRFFHVHIIHEAPYRLFVRDGIRESRVAFDSENGRYRRRMLFIGRKANVLVAQYLFEYLTAEFDRQWHDYQRQTGKERSARAGFLDGLYRGMCDRLEKEKQNLENAVTLTQRNALARRDRDVDDYLRELFPRLKSRNLRHDCCADFSAFASGVAAGRTIGIRQGINAHRSAKLLKP